MKDFSEKLVKNPEGGCESTDDENDGNDIETLDAIDLGDDSGPDVGLP